MTQTLIVQNFPRTIRARPTQNSRRCLVNEKRIREVIEVEKQALELLAQAQREAERLPVEAESAAREMIDKARVAARDEARKLVEQATSEEQAAEIIVRARAAMAERAKKANENFERAVTYVLERLVGAA